MSGYTLKTRLFLGISLLVLAFFETGFSYEKSKEPIPEKESQYQKVFLGKGKVSYFGGPKDPYMSNAKTAITGTPGKKLNPNDFYCAYRWDYSKYNKKTLLKSKVKIVFGDKEVYARPVDWGPHKRTGRILDVSKAVLKKIGAKTDDVVKVYLLTPGE